MKFINGAQLMYAAKVYDIRYQHNKRIILKYGNVIVCERENTLDSPKVRRREADIYFTEETGYGPE